MVANFEVDIANADNIKAETVVQEVLESIYEGTGASIDNIAGQHRKWDFEINHNGLLIRVDAKFDANYERYGRLPFEFQDVYPHGLPRPTWGVHPGLDFTAIVPWTFTKVVMVPLGSLGRYIAYKLMTSNKERLEEAEGWKWWESKNFSQTSTWVTHGVAVPESRFSAFLEALGEGKLLTLETDERHHREAPRRLNRIFLNGVEQGVQRPRATRGGVS